MTDIIRGTEELLEELNHILKDVNQHSSVVAETKDRVEAQLEVQDKLYLKRRRDMWGRRGSPISDWVGSPKAGIIEKKSNSSDLLLFSKKKKEIWGFVKTSLEASKPFNEHLTESLKGSIEEFIKTVKNNEEVYWNNISLSSDIFSNSSIELEIWSMNVVNIWSKPYKEFKITVIDTFDWKYKNYNLLCDENNQIIALNAYKIGSSAKEVLVNQEKYLKIRVTENWYWENNWYSGYSLNEKLHTEYLLKQRSIEDGPFILKKVCSFCPRSNENTSNIWIYSWNDWMFHIIDEINRKTKMTCSSAELTTILASVNSPKWKTKYENIKVEFTPEVIKKSDKIWSYTISSNHFLTKKDYWGRIEDDLNEISEIHIGDETREWTSWKTVRNYNSLNWESPAYWNWKEGENEKKSNDAIKKEGNDKINKIIEELKTIVWEWHEWNKTICHTCENSEKWRDGNFSHSTENYWFYEISIPVSKPTIEEVYESCDKQLHTSVIDDYLQKE